jgi:hypothetical protein
LRPSSSLTEVTGILEVIHLAPYSMMTDFEEKNLAEVLKGQVLIWPFL